MPMDEQREGELRKIADLAASAAAEKVVRVAGAAERERLQTAADAAAQLTLTASHTANALSEATKIDLQYIKDDLKEIKLRLDNKFVSLEIFEPVRRLVYGQVALILIAVVGGLLTMIIRKGP